MVFGGIHQDDFWQAFANLSLPRMYLAVALCQKTTHLVFKRL
jgi:hypothetical protein